MTIWEQEKMDGTDWQTVAALVCVALCGGGLGAMCVVWMVW